MQEKMTAEQAKTFIQKSAKNAAVLSAAAEIKRCFCEPYQDWFTYRRWQALGMQVQKGEKATRITTFIPYTKDVDGQEVTRTRPKVACVFCRCQVKEKS